MRFNIHLVAPNGATAKFRAAFPFLWKLISFVQIAVAVAIIFQLLQWTGLATVMFYLAGGSVLFVVLSFIWMAAQPNRSVGVISPITVIKSWFNTRRPNG